MPISKTITISDDSGFVALVNVDKYKSYVTSDWEYQQLIKHFTDQMVNNALVIWATGSVGTWAISFSNKPSAEHSYREFSKQIIVTEGKLFLTNYEDLTMAAQFEDETLPANHNKGLFVELDNGVYSITVRQLFDPSQSETRDGEAFEVVLQKADGLHEEQIDTVYWLTK